MEDVCTCCRGTGITIQTERRCACQPDHPALSAEGDDVMRDISGETVLGLRVAAYRETHPEHGDRFGHRYSEHWSTPNTRDPRVKVERLFTEEQVRALLQRLSVPNEEMVERPRFDFSAIYNEARKRFMNDATCPITIDETLAKVAFEHGLAALREQGEDGGGRCDSAGPKDIAQPQSSHNKKGKTNG